MNQAMVDLVVINDSILLDHFGSQLSLERVKEFLDFRKTWLWLNYLIIPLVYTIKFSLITLWVLSGSILFGYRSSFLEIFRVTVIAEFVWLIPSFITLVWFGFIYPDYSLLDFQYFKPLSLLNFFDTSKIESWLIFPLQSLNLFEIVYMFVLAIGIKKILNKGYIEALNFIAPVYGTAFVTWIVIITFLSINISA